MAVTDALGHRSVTENRVCMCSSTSISSPCTGLAAVASGLWPKGRPGVFCSGASRLPAARVGNVGKNKLG